MTFLWQTGLINIWSFNGIHHPILYCDPHEMLPTVFLLQWRLVSRFVLIQCIDQLNSDQLDIGP